MQDLGDCNVRQREAGDGARFYVGAMTDLDEARWAAVQRRDDTAAGLFFYAVRTTGVYCKPACPSRRPLRKNVEFFPTPADATASGFRACRRCRPDDNSEIDPTVASVIEVCRALEDPADVPAPAVLANQVGWSERHLRRVFKETTGITMAAYTRSHRADRARSALRNGSTVTDAAFDAGYGSLRSFYDHGAPHLGTTPKTFRRGSPDVTIRYAVATSALGEIIVAATDQGVCSVRLGDDGASLVDELRQDFPKATIQANDAADSADPGFDDVVGLVLELAEGRRTTAAIPLDIRGTAFQTEVWEALRSIEPGSVATYAEVAASIGRPTSHRAVANACGANPVALVVPCHRVVRSDGGAGGYRWGTERKEALLAAEQAAPLESKS